MGYFLNFQIISETYKAFKKEKKKKTFFITVNAQ